MPLSLVRRRTVWWPTLLGWACVLAFLCTSILLWLFHGEQFLSRNQRLNPQVLVVEGWIGIEGIQAAGTEFSQGGYSYLVASGGMTSNRWNVTRDSYAEMAERELLRFGVARDKLIFAGSDGTESRRTFQSATAVLRALRKRNLNPATINIFTFGSHARRSQMVFAKVFRGTSKVGVISWVPPGYIDKPWWRSSERSDDLIKESVGYIYELVLNSGRGFGTETAPEAP